MKSKKHKIPWDETLVIAVMIASALGILIILASYISATGNAAFSVIPSKDSVVGMLNSAVVAEGNIRLTKCEVECARLGKICLLARAGDNLVTCNDKIRGAYNCLCGSDDRIIAEKPTLPQ